ncbi:unnamed protein product, partial [marine sediment metagenome]
AWAEEQTFTTTGSIPAVATTPASHITAHNARLNGIVNPGNLETYVRFEYGTTTSYGSPVVNADQSPIPAGSGDVAVSADITGLSPGYTYHYRVVADNSIDISYGDDVTFWTLADTEPPTVEGVSTSGDYVGEPITVWADVHDGDGVGVQNVYLHYSQGGSSFIGTEMWGSYQYEATIDGSEVTVNGVICYVEAVDAVGNIALSETTYVQVRFPGYGLDTNVPGSAYPGAFPFESWRLISVPATLEQPQITAT